MIVGEMEIRLRADIARLQRDMDSARQVVGNATAGMERAANAAKGALAGIAAGFGAHQFAGMIDEYQKFTAQLKLATQSQREYAIAYADVKRISTQSTQGLQETGVLYARIANGTRELGVAQKQVAAITETVNLSLLVSGATASEAASAQLQLSQAFASGTLRGEEFNAVNEAAPRLMLALADGIGVPVGALKKMAEEGQITSKIMSDVLPNALDKLREEAKEVQTIAGAFTVLRNNVMEFVGMQAQASGVVAGLSGALILLADNLALVAGTALTLGAAKLGSIIGEWVVSTYRQVAAASALRAANIAAAESEVANTSAKVAQLGATQAMIVVAREEAMAKLASSNTSITAARTAMAAAQAAGVQSFALRTLRLATAELAVAEAQRAAMVAELAILGRQQAAVSAQITAATLAQTAAQAGLNAATTAGAGVAGLASRALGFLGGPIGAVITLLGVGAMAWSAWSNKATESEKEVARTLAEETDDYIANLQRQIDKLKERNELAGKRMTSGAEPVTDYDKRREAILAEINRISKDVDLSMEVKTEKLRVWGGRLNQVTVDMEKFNAEQQKNKDITFDSKYADWLGKNGTAAQRQAAELAELRKEFGRVTPEMEKWVKAKYADNKAINSAARDAKEAQEKERAMLVELAGLTSSFADDWDRLSAAYGKGKLSLDELTKAQAKLLADQPAMKKALEEEAAARKAVEEFSEGYAQGLAATTSIRQDEISAAKEQVKANEQLVATFGMSEAALATLDVARLKDQLAQRSSLGLTLDEIEHLEQLISLKERSAAALADVQALEQTRDFWSSVEQTAHDTFVSIQDGSKSMFERMKDTAKNVFFDWLYQMTLKKWIINIGTAISGTAGVSGIANAAAGGIAGTGGVGEALSLGGSLSNLYSAVTGGATVAGGLGAGFLGSLAGGLNGAGMGSGLTSAIGMNIGNGIASVVGPNIASGIASGLSGLAAAAPWVAGALAVVSIGKAAFGRGPKEYSGEQTLNGSLGAGGFTGTMDADWVKKGGWFRSDKKGTDRNPVGAEFAAGLTSAYDAIKTTSADFARVLGINADSIANRTQAIKIALGKDEAANQAAIAEFFTGVANTVAGELLPEISKFQQEGEEAAGTLQRLAVNFAGVDQILAIMGSNSQAAFGAVGTASIAARERLVAFAGGIDALAAATTFFNENFLSEAERVAIIQKPLQEGLAALGFAGLTTLDQFKEAAQGLVASGALATEQGAKQYAGLLSLGPQYKVVADYLQSVSDAAVESARQEAEAAKKLGAARLNLEIQIMELQGDAIGALGARRREELESADESLRPLYQRIHALQDEKTAAEAAATAAQAAKDAAAAAAQAVKDAASSLMGGVDSALSVLQRVVDRQKRALQDEINVRTKSVQAIQSLSQALHGALDGMSPAGFEAEDRRTAQADIQKALAIAKASGVLPDADDLKGALSVLGKDSASQFANREDYLRDFYATRNGIEDLAGLTDDALSVEERSLKSLEDQVKQYDRMLERQQEQIDIAKGQSIIGLSIEQAIQGVQTALAAAMANPVNSATSAINDAYKSALGRAPDQAGLDFWQDKAANGVSQGAIVDAIKNSPEAQVQKLYREVFGRAADAGGLQFWVGQMNSGMSLATIRSWMLASDEKKTRIPGFAGGGDHAGGWRLVGEDGPELEATGPSRIFNAGQTRDLMSRLASPADNSTALAAAVDRLNATVDRQAKIIDRQGRALEQIQKNTKRQADTLDIVTEGGKAMRSKEQQGSAA